MNGLIRFTTIGMWCDTPPTHWAEIAEPKVQRDANRRHRDRLLKRDSENDARVSKLRRLPSTAETIKTADVPPAQTHGMRKLSGRATWNGFKTELELADGQRKSVLGCELFDPLRFPSNTKPKNTNQ